MHLNVSVKSDMVMKASFSRDEGVHSCLVASWLDVVLSQV